MADVTIQEFRFTKDWNNPADFPTFQSDERQVRADLQELHNQTRDFINTDILQAINKVISDTKEFVENATGENKELVDETIADLETFVQNAVRDALLGTVPDNSIEFVKLACVDTQLDPEAGEKLPTSEAVAQHVAYVVDDAVLESRTEILDTVAADRKESLAEVEAKRIKMATGSYTGNGYYGPAYPTTLSFDFVPALVIVRQSSSIKQSPTAIGVILINSMPSAFPEYNHNDGDATRTRPLTNVSWGEKSVSWYMKGSTSSDKSGGPGGDQYYQAYSQLNGEGSTYHYVAFGV